MLRPCTSSHSASIMTGWYKLQHQQAHKQQQCGHTATQQMGVGFDLLSQSKEQGLVLHSFQVQVGVRVQYLQALEQLIIKPLNETHQVTPYLQTPLYHQALYRNNFWCVVAGGGVLWLAAATSIAQL